MIGNFQIEESSFLKTRDDLIDLGYDVMLLNWELMPVSSLFTSNLSGKRYLKSFGNTYNFKIKIQEIASEDMQEFIDLNGQVVQFKQDIDDSITHETNCTITPLRDNGKPYYNAVIISLDSVQSAHETSDRRQIVNPSTMYEESQEFITKVYDSDGETLMKYYE
jgi:hypothetical protein